MAGLRERKKQATRLAIRDAGMRLFDERGFTATTIDQIAEAAEVSRATVLNYFATKEDIVFGDAHLAVAALRDALAPGEHTIAAFRAWLRALVELGGWIEPELVLQLRLADDAPTVGARRLALHRDMEAIIAASLVVELGPEHHVAANLAAAALMAAMEVVESAAADNGGTLAAPVIDALLDDAVGFTEAGVTAMQQR